MKKIKEFAKKHKTAICTTGTIIVGGVILYALYASKGKLKTTKIPIAHVKDVVPIKTSAPEALVKFGVNDVDVYTGAIECMTAFSPHYSVAVGDLGKFGEALCEVPGITPDSLAFALINVAKQ